MDILVCQSCGAFIRGKARFCTGCGVHVTKFSPTSLPFVAQSSMPLVVALSPDPANLERALVEEKYAKYNGGNGNGDYQSPEESVLEPLPPASEDFSPIETSAAAPSQLTNIIASAASRPLQSRAPVDNQMFDLLTPEPEPEPEPEPIPAPPVHEEPQYFGGEIGGGEVEQPVEPAAPVMPSPLVPPVLPTSSQFFTPTLPTGAPPPLPPAPPTSTPSFEPTGADSFASDSFTPTTPAPELVAEPNPQLTPEQITQTIQSQPEPVIQPPIPPANSGGGFAPVPRTQAPSDFFPALPATPQQSTPSPAASTSEVAPAASDATESSPKPATGSFPAMPSSSALPPMSSDQSYASDTTSAESSKQAGVDAEDTGGSGQAEQVRGLLARRARNKAKEEHDDAPDNDKPSPMKMLGGQMEIAGKNVPKVAVIAGGLVALVIAFQLLGPIFGFAGKAIADLWSQQQIGNLPSLTGDWQNRYQVGKKITNGRFHLDQVGTNLQGKGADPQLYVLAGEYHPPSVTFRKQYLTPDGDPDGKPVNCNGKVKFEEDGRPTMVGFYSKEVAKGQFIHRRVVLLQGPWDAWMLHRTAVQTNGTSGIPTLPVPWGGGGQEQLPQDSGKDPVAKQREFFMKVAFGILIFCVLLAMASLKVFGPSGLLNIWGKKEYIPSQFKREHNKMVKEMGKPIKKGGVPLGKRLDWNILQFDKPQNLSMPPKMRDSNPHMLVMGAGQKGKTRLIANMITSDIASGDRAVIVVDSDGGLVDKIVNWIAAQPKGKQYAERVIIMDPTHKGGCPSYNPLELPENEDLQGAASAIVYGFKAIYTEPPGSQSQWNQQTANIVRNAALLLMINGKTLTDLERLLGADNDFRDVMLDQLKRKTPQRPEYSTLLTQWDTYIRLGRGDQWITWTEPIRNRIAGALSDPRISPILSKAKGDINLSDVLNQKKILLVKIPQSTFDENANLLGSLLVTGIKQAALSSNSGRSGAKCQSALYLDEFEHFIEKDTIDAITSETKTFQIGLVGTSKTLQHLPEDARNQMIIHMGTICAFSLAKKDADMLGPSMFRVDGRKIKHQTIQNVFNKVNTTPQFELISDEEKLNIDRVVGQEERTFFCYRVGTVAGVFHLRAHEFKDIPEKDINWSLVEQMYGKA